MRCPICNAKMLEGAICKYCGVTSEQVKNASNKKVKEYRKKDMSDLIYFTTDIPDDVNKVALFMYTLFFGVIGVNHYYVKRNIRATFSLLSTVLSLTFLILRMAVPGVANVLYFRLIYEVAFTTMAINVVLWICDFFNLIFHKFKVPVVLGDKEGSK